MRCCRWAHANLFMQQPAGLCGDLMKQGVSTEPHPSPPAELSGQRLDSSCTCVNFMHNVGHSVANMNMKE
jgi:hypothetical protein